MSYFEITSESIKNGQVESYFGPAFAVFRSVYVGGNWDNGSNAGVSYVNANNSLSNSNNNVGSRLNYVREYLTLISTSALAEKTEKKECLARTVKWERQTDKHRPVVY